MKYDPLKYQKSHKVLDRGTASVQTGKTVSELTWNIEDQETEMTRKRKGIFPAYSPVKKKVVLSAEALEYKRLLEQPDDLEVVMSGSGRKMIKRQYDSDSEEDANDSVGSADTDEIIAVNKSSKTKSDSSMSNLAAKRKNEDNLAVLNAENSRRTSSLEKEADVRNNSDGITSISQGEDPIGNNAHMILSKSKSQLDSMNIHEDSDSADSADTDEFIMRSKKKCPDQMNKLKNPEKEIARNEDLVKESDDEDIFDLIDSGNMGALVAITNEKANNSMNQIKAEKEAAVSKKQQESKSKRESISNTELPLKQDCPKNMNATQLPTIKQSESDKLSKVPTIKQSDSDKLTKVPKREKIKKLGKATEKSDLKKERKAQSEQKRLESIKQKTQQMRNQKLAVQQALANVVSHSQDVSGIKL